MEKKRIKRTIRYPLMLTVEENEQFLKNSKTALASSRADYLRRLALNYIIYSKTDNENFRSFLRVAGQQGKTIGLLKIYLTEYPNNEATHEKIMKLIDELSEYRTQLKILSDKIL